MGHKKVVWDRTSRFGQSPEDVVQNAAVLEVLDLNVGIESDLDFKRLAGVS